MHYAVDPMPAASTLNTDQHAWSLGGAARMWPKQTSPALTAQLRSAGAVLLAGSSSQKRRRSQTRRRLQLLDCDRACNSATDERLAPTRSSRASGPSVGRTRYSGDRGGLVSFLWTAGSRWLENRKTRPPRYRRKTGSAGSLHGDQALARSDQCSL